MHTIVKETFQNARFLLGIDKYGQIRHPGVSLKNPSEFILQKWTLRKSIDEVEESGVEESEAILSYYK